METNKSLDKSYMGIKRYSEHSEFQKDIEMLNNIRDVFLDIEDEFNFWLEYQFLNPKYNASKDRDYLRVTSYNINGDINYEIVPKLEAHLLKKKWSVKFNGIPKYGSLVPRDSYIEISKLVDHLKSLIKRITDMYELEIEDRFSYVIWDGDHGKKIFYFKTDFLPKDIARNDVPDGSKSESFMLQINFI